MMLPQVGVSGGMPMPRNHRIASIRIAAAQMKVPCTISGAMRVRQDVAEQQQRRRRADADRRLDVGLLAHGQHDRAHQAHDARNLGHDDGDDHGEQAGAEQRDQRDGEQYRRDRHQPVHDPHHDRVEPADVAGDQADHEPDRDADEPTTTRRRSARRARRRARGCRRRGRGCRCPSGTVNASRACRRRLRMVCSEPGVLVARARIDRGRDRRCRAAAPRWRSAA